jgi:hypothetical protein
VKGNASVAGQRWALASMTPVVGYALTMIRVAARFRGPPQSGNGGYSAGLLARHWQSASGVSGAVEVTLRKPPPLECDLDLLLEGDRALLTNSAELIAEARSATLDVQPPEPPSWERAAALSRHYVGHARHHFPGCFVCGPGRQAGDGLRIFPGAEQPGEPVAAPWLPDASLAEPGGELPSEMVWAALDCAGYFAVAAPSYPVALLGRMTAEVLSSVRVDERCVVVGWALGRQGRKLAAATAVFGQNGKLYGRARQTWILLERAVAEPHAP